VLAVAGAAHDAPDRADHRSGAVGGADGPGRDLCRAAAERGIRWIAWVGLLLILYVALKMIFDGYLDVTGCGKNGVAQLPQCAAGLDSPECKATVEALQCPWYAPDLFKE
jgi:hypothetical protein